MDVIYKNRDYPLETVRIIEKKDADGQTRLMMGMNGMEEVIIIKYKRITDIFGKPNDFWTDETTFENFHDKYVSISEESS